jgi:hypothetical protein
MRTFLRLAVLLTFGAVLDAAPLTTAFAAVPTSLNRADLQHKALQVGHPRSVLSDFNGDGFADLAVGTPFEDVGSVGQAGAVNVLYGSALGLQATGDGGPDDQSWTQDSPDIAGDGAETGDQFGAFLAGGDFNADGFADLAIGVPFEDVGSIPLAGAVNVLYGSPAGLQVTGTGGPDDQFWTQGSNGMADAAENSDEFGIPVTAGDFNADGFVDLAIGVPDESLPGAKGAGAVAILYGSATGLQADGNGGPDDQFWNQDSPAVQDRAEAADSFGSGVAAGDFNADGFTDLAISVTLENITGVADTGAIAVLYGSGTGLQAAAPDDQFWTQDSAGVRDVAEAGDKYGAYVTTGDFDADGFADVAVGIRFEDVGTVMDAGAVSVLYGSETGLQAIGSGGHDDQFWTQGTGGVQDRAEPQDRFGRALAVGDFNGDDYDDLAIAVYLEDVGSIFNAGAVAVLYGSADGLQADGNGAPDDQYWNQNSPDVQDQAEPQDGFGSAVTAGDFDGDGHGDLAVGVPNEALGTVPSAGAVNVLYGSADGLQAVSPDDQFWTQDTPGLAGDGAEKADDFGGALASRH